METTSEIRKLNTLRGLAALIVFATHFSDVTGWLDGRLGGRAGQYGVMLFFLLSGFLMSYLYLNKAFNKLNIKKYILARAGRVIPLYLLVVLTSYLLTMYGVDGLYDISNSKELLAHLLFLYGESVLWTIPPEIQFYSLFLVFWFLATWRVGYVYLLIVAVLILLFFANFLRIHGEVSGIPYNFFHLFRSLPYFFVGLIFGMHYRTLFIPEYLRKNWFLLALLLIPLMYPQFSPVTSDARMKMWLNYEVLFVMSAVFFALVFLVPDKNIVLANKLGDFFGKISYSLYLLHLPVIVQVNKLDYAAETKLFISLVSCVFLSYLSFRFIEKPTAGFIRRLGS